MEIISATPGVNIQGPTNSCSHIATAAHAANPSGPMTGIRIDRPNSRLRPVAARTRNDTAVTQCTNRSHAVQRTTFTPDAPSSSLTLPTIA